MPDRSLSTLAVHGRQIVLAWADDLAAYLGRPREEIAARGLGAGDFCNQSVQVRFDDGSEAYFRYAFALPSQAQRATAIFTEHCGYFIVGFDVRITVVHEDAITAETQAIDE